MMILFNNKITKSKRTFAKARFFYYIGKNEFFSYYSSFVVFIFNNLKISTIIIGANTKQITSKMFSTGNAQILNICLKVGINKIVIINNADTKIAKINFILLNGFVFKIECLLSLILNTWTSWDKANTENAIVWPISILTCSTYSGVPCILGVARPIQNAYTSRHDGVCL